MSSSLQFLVGSEGSYVYTYSFNPSTKSLELVTKSGNFTTPSWVEPSQNAALKGKVYYAASEEGGKILSLELQSDGSLTETGSAPTGGSPAHVHALKDGSGVVATNYLGGSAVFIPVDNSTGAITVQASTIQSVLSNLTTNVGSVSPVLKFTSPYSRTGPNKERQDASHPHQCIEGSNGDLYVPDLGSDRIWQLKRKGVNELEITGVADGRSGVGPRHAALHSNGKYLYLITELAHEVFIYPVRFGGPDVTALHPEGPAITPTEIPIELKPEMTAGELVLHPVNDRVLYISNRGQVDLNEKSGQHAKGDAIAVVTLNEAGDQIENVDIVRTEINFIRGMKITSDGKYLGLVGQKDGKVAVYETGGKFGEKIELVVQVDAGLNQPTDVTWV